MTAHSAVTVFAARYDRVLGRGEDSSHRPVGATFFSGGTEVNWATADGHPDRDRFVRVWLAVWPDAAMARDHYDGRNALIPILTEAKETVAVLCHPYACHGQVNWSEDGLALGLHPSLAPRPDGAPPIFVITTIGIGDPEDGLVAFGQGVTAVRQAFAQNPAVVMDINSLTDDQRMDSPTLTLWRSERAMMDAAYRSEPHRTALKMRNGALVRASFTRLAIEAAEGSWAGVDIARAIEPEPEPESKAGDEHQGIGSGDRAPDHSR